MSPSSPPAASERTPLLPPPTSSVDPDVPVPTPPLTTGPSPFHIAFPLFASTLSFSISAVPTQQFLLVYLCKQWLQKGAVDHLGTISAGAHEAIGADPDFATCRTIPDVQSLTAHWSMAITLCTSLPALLSIPLIGHLSDRFGRRPVFLLPMLSGLIGVLAIIAIAQFDWPLGILLAAHVLQGLMGGYTAIMMVVYSYLADTVDPNRTGKVFTVVDAAVFVALTIGPYTGGVLTRWLPQGVVGVFYVSVVGKLLALLYVIFILPESLNTRKLLSASAASAAPLPHPSTAPPHPKRGLWTRLTTPSPLLRSLTVPPLCYLLMVAFITSIVIGGAPLFFFYASFRFGWDALDEGVYLLYMSVTRMFWMLGVGGWIDKWASRPAGQIQLEQQQQHQQAGEDENAPLLSVSTQLSPPPPAYTPEVEDSGIAATAGSSSSTSSPLLPQPPPIDINRKVHIDLMVVRIGMIVLAVGWTIMGFLPQGWMVYIFAFVTGFGTLAKPLIRSLLSRSTAASQQGRLFSLLQLLDNSATVISNLVFPPLWAATVGSRFPGAFLSLMGALFAVAAAVSCACVATTHVVAVLHRAREERGEATGPPPE
ncbi:hypothetical protein PhCBS80983_g01018 [Powellomyces hirtus]|uniref:Major facilitator superfamily (MFS) profile domain-containing protein n=1 Tax=Powellomyces hirtus TaxID=109895 RepID=A0A507EBS3_9FUNG|nr:hypothetical protein PhCBS80983_g01018 [Powellomyces hirtus]